MCIGERGNDDNGSNSGQVRVFKYSDVISDWNQVGFDIEGESANDFSGSPVRITGDGNRVAIGAYGNDDGGSNSGHVRVFDYNSSQKIWVQTGQDIDGDMANDNSGFSMDMSVDGQYLIIGSNGSNGGGNVRGHSKVYKLKNGIWVQVGADINGGQNYEQSGYSVSISDNGRIVAIGSRSYDGAGNSSGKVRIYKYDSGLWVKATNDINGLNSEDQCGSGISMSSNGSIVAIGESGYGPIGGKGRIRVFDLGICEESFETIYPIVNCSFTSSNGNVYRNSGVYIDTLINMYGCDSFLTINLTIRRPKFLSNPNDTAVFIGDAATFKVQGDESAMFQWQSDMGFGFQNLSNAGQFSGSDSSDLTVSNVIKWNDNQMFRCVISNGNCFDTSNNAVLTVLGVNSTSSLKASKLSVFPNPTSGLISIHVPQNSIGETFSIYTTFGVKLLTQSITQQKTFLDLRKYPKGLYYLKTSNQLIKVILSD